MWVELSLWFWFAFLWYQWCWTFSCACWPSVYLLWKNIYSGLLPIFNWVACFLLVLSCMNHLYILDVNLLECVCVCVCVCVCGCGVCVYVCVCMCGCGCVSCSVMSNSLDPVDCSPPGSSVQGVLQARIMEWLPFPSPGDLPDPGIEPGSSVLQADS